MRVFEAVADAIFFLDVFATFFTSYRDEVRDIIVTSPRHIRARYLRGWFAVDLASALPLDWVVRWANSDGAAPEVLRLGKLLRMYRVLYAGTHSDPSSETTVSPALVSLLQVICWMLMVWHWVACFYCWMSLREPGVPDEGFVRPGELVVFNTSEPWIAPVEVATGNRAVFYFYSLWWSVGVVGSLSAPEPNTLPQLAFTMSISVVGIFAMSTIIGTASAAVAEMQSQRAEAARRLQNVERYMKTKHLPRGIRQRVISYYRFQQASLNILEDEDVLSNLPRALRMQIAIQMYQPVFIQLPLFWLCEPEELLLIVQRLRPCLVSVDEMLCKEGCLGIGLFLLLKGSVQITQNSRLLVVMLATAAFGENALRQDPVESDVTVRALQFCEASLLDRDDFRAIARMNPSIETWLNIYIRERDRRLKDPSVQAQSRQAMKATLRHGAAKGEFGFGADAVAETQRAHDEAGWSMLRGLAPARAAWDAALLRVRGAAQEGARRASSGFAFQPTQPPPDERPAETSGEHPVSQQAKALERAASRAPHARQNRTCSLAAPASSELGGAKKVESVVKKRRRTSLQGLKEMLQRTARAQGLCDASSASATRDGLPCTVRESDVSPSSDDSFRMLGGTRLARADGSSELRACAV
jgi:CRP-like cAMP-binding protein